MSHDFRRCGAWFRVAGALALLLAAAPASARVVRDLYTVVEPVQGQDATERLGAFRDALAQVFVRVSGDAQAGADAKLQAALQDPARFVQEYRYEQAPATAPAVTPAGAAVAGSAAGAGAPAPAPSAAVAGTSPAATAPGTAPAPGALASPTSAASPRSAAPAALGLWVRFDPDAVRAALRQAGLPVWGDARPTTLLWLAVEDGVRRSILAEDDQSPLEQALLAAASARGVPVILPLMDLEDERNVSFGDLWGGFSAPVRAASARYGTHAILVGRIRHFAGGPWSARWTLYSGTRTSRWRTTADAEAPLLAAGVDGLADRLAAQFALPAGASARGLVEIEITGVRSLADYARARAYLRGLSPVLHVQTVAVAPDRARFRLEVQGDAQGLEQAIGLGRTLTPAPAAGPVTLGGGGPTPAGQTAPAGTNPSGPAVAVYRLVP